MTRVLMLAQACPPVVGGVESHVEDLRRGLAARGHDIAVACGRGGEAVSGVLTSPALAGADLFSDAPLDAAALERLLEGLRSEWAPEVVHVHNPNHFAPALADAVLGRGERCVASVHDRPVEPGHNETLLRQWDHVLFASEYLRRELPRPGSSSVLHLGIDTSAFRPGIEPHAALSRLSRPVVFHPARLLAWKGVLDSAAAFVQVRAQLGSGTLVLAKSSAILSDSAGVRALTGEVLAILRSAGIKDAVLFRDFGRSEMPAAYAASDVIWYPTRSEEPYGLVPLEAMACGRPVVVTASGGMRETVAGRPGAIVIEPGDVDALAAVTLGLLRDRERCAQLGADAARCAGDWSLGSYLNRLERVYAHAGA